MKHNPTIETGHLVSSPRFRIRLVDVCILLLLVAILWGPISIMQQHRASTRALVNLHDSMMQQGPALVFNSTPGVTRETLRGMVEDRAMQSMIEIGQLPEGSTVESFREDDPTGHAFFLQLVNRETETALIRLRKDQ